MLKKQNEGSIRVVFLLGCVVGCVLFISLYGWRVLNPSYVDWLKSGDTGNHYLGWLYYRHSDWYFPIGLFDGINEQKTSIFMMDSIPHFALLFKLLSPILPEIFQYFGFFGIFSFALMGGFSSILLFRISGNTSLSLTFSTVFIFSPYALQRMFAHTALASQWIIVAALYLWIWKPGKGKKRNVVLWCLLMVGASGIHLYFIPILMVCLFCCTIQDWMEKEQMRSLLIRFFLTPLAGLATIWIYGGFSSSIHREADEHGYYIANLNSLINPQGTGTLMRDLPLSPNGGQYEGYGYLGFGILIGIVIVFTFFYICRRQEDERLFSKTLSYSILLGLITFAIISTGFSFWWCDQCIAIPKLPYFLTRIFTFFRSAGRFIWGADYLIYFIVFAGIYRLSKDKNLRANVFILVLTFLQFADLGAYILKVHANEQYRSYLDHSSVYNQVAWNTIFAGKEHLKYIRDVDWEKIFSYQFLNICAAESGLSVNQAASSNLDMNTLQENVDHTREELRQGEVQAETIYAFSPDDPTLAYYPLYYYEIDQWVLGVKDIVPELSSTQGVSEIIPNDYGIDYDKAAFDPTVYLAMQHGELAHIFCMGDEWNAKEYISKGISFNETFFTWTEGSELLFYPIQITNYDGAPLCLTLSATAAYNGSQRLVVYCNEEKVTETIVPGDGGQINIPIRADENGALQIRLELPDAVSPDEIEHTGDTRQLALMLTDMSIILEK